MNVRVYFNNEKICAGITLKNKNKQTEMNNMALHACNNEITIVQNRTLLAEKLNRSINDFVCADQTHSANFYEVTEEDCSRGAIHQQTAIPNTDALFTFEKNIVLCAFSADCVPVYFFDEEYQVVGVVHSGWKGTVREITKKTLQHIISTKQIRPENLHVQIGMAISQKRFEVDGDVYDQYVALKYAEPFIYFNEQTKKYHIDNQLVIKRQCELLQIPAEQIYLDQSCTYDSPNGFSHREDKQAGRHLAFIMKK